MSDDEKAGAKMLELEKEKDRLIHRYIKMQDQADDLNGEIFSVCCNIEVLNKRIEQAREDLTKALQKAALKAAQTAGGNGNGHT